MLWKLATADHCLNDNLTPKTTLTPDYRCIQTNKGPYMAKGPEENTLNLTGHIFLSVSYFKKI